MEAWDHPNTRPVTVNHMTCCMCVVPAEACWPWREGAEPVDW